MSARIVQTGGDYFEVYRRNSPEERWTRSAEFLYASDARAHVGFLSGRVGEAYIAIINRSDNA